MSEIGPDTRWFTCLQDGRDHAVTDDEFVLCNEPPPGYVQAVCGHRVRLAPAATPPRPTCPKCVQLLAARRSAAAPTKPARDRWYRRARAPAKDHDRGASARHSWPVAGGGKGHDGQLTVGGHERPPRASRQRRHPPRRWRNLVRALFHTSPAREAWTR